MSGRARGRGRGGRGGRGRGSSRGGGSTRGTSRGRGGCGGCGGRGGRRGGFNQSTSVEDKQNMEISPEDKTLDIKTDLKKFFVGTASFDQHFDAQNDNKYRYAAGMALLEESGVEISQNARARGLAAAWARNDQELSDSLLINKDSFGLVEVLKAVTLLDSARRIREEEKKLKKIMMQTGGKVKPKVLGKFKSNIDNLTANKPKIGSASGAVCNRIRQWVRNFTKEELEFYALHYPTEPWKKLADICHFHPKEDFPNLPWFLSFCFGAAAPEGSMVGSCRDVSEENVNKLLEDHAVPYSHIKDQRGNLSDESKGRIAQTDKLDQILWYYEDLQCSEVDEILSERLLKGAKTSLPTGKLIERLLTIKMIREGISPRRSYRSVRTRNANPAKAAFIHHLIPQAQKCLNDIRLILDTPVVVMGDKSSSMEVAIRTSTIIASLLTAICGATLVFFDHENMVAPFIPTDIEEVLEMAVTIKTGGSTNPAASLWPFYRWKKVMKTIIMVTDEEENGSVNNMRFADLFKKYRSEVSPHCKLVFVSFLRGQHETGQMMRALHNMGIRDNLIQFKFDQKRPDLSKLDKLFGLLSSETEDFEEHVREMEINMRTKGMIDMFKKLHLDQEAESKKNADDQAGNVPVPKAAWGDETDTIATSSTTITQSPASLATSTTVSDTGTTQSVNKEND